MATGARVVAAAQLEAVPTAGVRSPDVYGLLYRLGRVRSEQRRRLNVLSWWSAVTAAQ